MSVNLRAVVAALTLASAVTACGSSGASTPSNESASSTTVGMGSSSPPPQVLAVSSSFPSYFPSGAATCEVSAGTSIVAGTTVRVVFARGKFGKSVSGTLNVTLAVRDAAGIDLTSGNSSSGHYNSPAVGSYWQAQAYIPAGFTPMGCDIEPQPDGSGPARLVEDPFCVRNPGASSCNRSPDDTGPHSIN